MVSTIFKSISLFTLVLAFHSCQEEKTKTVEVEKTIESTPIDHSSMGNDPRISLHLIPKQKNHQLKNMRSHLEAVQNIIQLLSEEKYDDASLIAYEKLGSTTEMRLMCASFGNEEFENLGLEFHKSADELSEIIKLKDKNKSLEALSKTMNYCVQCHSTFRQ